MRIIIDIGHPAHVHLFKNFAWEMQNRGHSLLFTCRDKEFELDLLNTYGFKFISFGKHYKKLKGKLWGLFKFNFKMLKVARSFKPDLFLSAGSMYAAQVACMLKKPHIAFEDTGNMEQIKLYLPFTSVVFSPTILKKNLGKRQIEYDSFHELAYLNPKFFTPDKAIFSYLGIEEHVKFVILRFVSWNATHDVGQGGFSAFQKDEMVDYLSSEYKLFISSEGEVPARYEKYLIKISPDKIHDAMAYASIVISEGATMASEAGVLGTPAIYVNSLPACNNLEQEKYGLVFNFESGEGVIDKIKELQSIKNKDEFYAVRRNDLLNNMLDITSILIWFVENYPESIDDIDGFLMNSFRF